MFYRKSLMLRIPLNRAVESIFVPMKSKDGYYILDYRGTVLKTKISDLVDKKLFLETFYNYYAKTFNFKYEIVPCFKILNKIFSFVEFKNEFGEYVYKILMYDPEDMRFTDDICFSSPYQLNEFEVIRKLCITKYIEIDDTLEESDEEFYDTEFQSLFKQ